MVRESDLVTDLFNRLGSLGLLLIASALIVGGLAGAAVAHHYETLSTQSAASHQQQGNAQDQQGDAGDQQGEHSDKEISKPIPKPRPHSTPAPNKAKPTPSASPNPKASASPKPSAETS